MISAWLPRLCFGTQSSNAPMWTEDQDIESKFLIRDRDRKYAVIFDAFRKEAGVRPVKIPPRAPMASVL